MYLSYGSNILFSIYPNLHRKISLFWDFWSLHLMFILDMNLALDAISLFSMQIMIQEFSFLSQMYMQFLIWVDLKLDVVYHSNLALMNEISFNAKKTDLLKSVSTLQQTDSNRLFISYKVCCNKANEQCKAEYLKLMQF